MLLLVYLPFPFSSLLLFRCFPVLTHFFYYADQLLDSLRVLLKSFPKEEVIVKLQVLHLGARIYLRYLLQDSTTPASDRDVAKKLYDYLFNLAKYDSSYDIRDRARLLKQLLEDPKNELPLLKAQLSALLAPSHDAAPTSTDYKPPSKDLNPYYYGTLANIMRTATRHYTELPDVRRFLLLLFSSFTKETL